MTDNPYANQIPLDELKAMLDADPMNPVLNGQYNWRLSRLLATMNDTERWERQAPLLRPKE